MHFSDASLSHSDSFLHPLSSQSFYCVIHRTKESDVDP